jgi:hypothetical protein
MKVRTLELVNELVNSFLDPNKVPLVVYSLVEPQRFPDLASTDPVLHGRCQFTIDYWRVSASPVFSKVYENPTWKDILNACNDLLQEGDKCGVFLENIVEEKKGLYAFHIGS